MPTPAATLRASLERHNATFEALLKLIPAKYYIVQDQSEEQVLLPATFIHPFFHLSMCTFQPGFKIPETQQEAESTQTGYQRGDQEG